MKLTTQATEQLLESLRLLTCSEYMQVSELGLNGYERINCGHLSHALLAIQQSPPIEFALELEHILNELTIAISLLNKQRMLISVQEQQADPRGQRRPTIIKPDNQRRLNIELLTSNTFPSWLTNLCNMEHNERKDHQQMQLLQLCCCLFNSSKVFAQFQLLTVDSLTKLQTRNSLQRRVDENIKQSAMTLCMFHCRDFQIVNRKFGQAKGDQVLNEIAAIISHHTRSDDLACRFGGALFGIVNNANDVEEGLKLAQKLQTELHNRPYLKNAIRLSFNVGVAHVTKEDCNDTDTSASTIMITRAEQALKAAQTSDKPNIVHWEADKFKHDEQDFNYIGGIFTPDNVTNYRNMLLLWDISSIIADEHEFRRLLANVVERLAYTFEFSAAGIIAQSTDCSFEQALSVSAMADVSPININASTITKELRDLAKQAIEMGRHIEHQNEHKRFLLIPLGAELNACFFIVGEETAFDLAHNSVMLFAGFARQIGRALKRSQLEDELNRNLEKQNAQLEDELKELKTGLQSSALVYRSQVMENMVNQTQRAAQTDTTILVTGESGTGKEKLIHAIHKLGPRNNAPLVIVDCGSIPETLIESELFGYVKGAFTGAQSHTTGKIQAADGGILVLDEVGELPMSMQPKLLRFVQEKHVTPVGAKKAISVDVKIVALTHRDLAKEVQRGTFRQDLYFRLNVVSLHNPPLRERLEDLELLTQHFLTKFAIQFETTRKYLSSETLQKMQKYHWPGNIRELENKLMQASLLCQGNEILFEDINLEMPKNTNLIAHQTYAQNQVATANYDVQPLPLMAAYSPDLDSLTAHQSRLPRPATCSSPIRASINKDTWLKDYDDAINALISELKSAHEYYHYEPGIWIELSLFQYTYQHCRTNKLIAARLQIPISTARRKVNKASQFSLPTICPPAWQPISALLDTLAQGQVCIANPLDTLKLHLLSTILKHNPHNMTHAAQLLGVSEPTLYKLKRGL